MEGAPRWAMPLLWLSMSLAWLTMLAIPIVGYLLFGWKGVAGSLLFYAVGFSPAVPLVLWRWRIRTGLTAGADAAARAEARAAVQAAGGGDALIRAALRAADEALERARRAGGMTRGQRVSVIAQVRAIYDRTDDELGDAVRALRLAHEAERAAAEHAAIDDGFNDWLRKSGSRFMT